MLYQIEMKDNCKYFIEVKWLCPAQIENKKNQTWDVPYTNRSDNYRTVTFEYYRSMCNSMTEKCETGLATLDF
jgi:hypothetical protein